jgi:hypothetical protein
MRGVNWDGIPDETGIDGRVAVIQEEYAPRPAPAPHRPDQGPARFSFVHVAGDLPNESGRFP